MGSFLLAAEVAGECTRSNELSVFVSRAGTYVILFLKHAVLLTIWFSAIPLLLGILLEAAVVVPLRTALNESPSYHLVQSWATGLLLLNIWLR